MTYDIVIIGSGLGGLQCAELLSQAGRGVMVLERAGLPGGCLCNYSRAGMTFDTGFHYVGGIGEGQSLHEPFRRLGLLGLPWHKLDAGGFDRVMIGSDNYVFAEGFDEFAAALACRFPSERVALGRYAMLLKRTAATTPVVQEAESDRRLTEWMLRTSAYAYLENTFADTRLRAVLAGTSLKTGLHKETLPLFSFVHGNAGYVESSWRLRGGSTLIADTLAGRIRQRGGEIVCGADVRRLTMAGGRITAAECADGRTVTGRAFICDIHPAVVCSLVPEMRKSYARRITAMRNGTGMVTVSLRLKPRTLPYFNYNQYVYSHPDVWGADGTGDSVCGVLVSCRVPDGGGYYATQLDLLTPSDWNSWSRWAQTMTGRRGDDYKAAKNRIADECVRLAENFIPGLSGMVAGRYVSTPLTWRDYTATPEGCAYGLRKDFNMLMGGCLSLQTPVPNLFLTGQSPVLHGLHGVTMTALATCRLVAALG